MNDHASTGKFTLDRPARCCGGLLPLDRREFLKTTGAATIALTAPTLYGTTDVNANNRKDARVVEHLVPDEKNLPPDWVKSLYARGEPAVYRGKESETIGMPVGGIGAGQLYLLGDGTLGCWQIFNKAHFTGYGETNYARRIPESPVDQGFAVRIRNEGMSTVVKLGREDFPDIEFDGRYPIRRIRYRRDDLPVDIDLEAFSPFIPLNAADSALPATLFHVLLENNSENTASVDVLGWLENAVCIHSGETVAGLRRTRLVSEQGRSLVIHCAEEEVRKPGADARPAIPLADFEGGTYGDWRAEGNAMGSAPATGTLPNQQRVSGFDRNGLVNTFLGGDAPHGTLTSPPFTISRRYLSFLIGGGNHENETCINLLIDGDVVCTATGEQNEALTWRTWNVVAFEGQEARIQIIDRNSESWGHINIDQVELSDDGRANAGTSVVVQPDYGTMVLALDEQAAPYAEAQALLESMERLEALPVEDTDSTSPNTIRRNGAILTSAFRLEPGARKEFTFVLAWHFPNHGPGHAYAERFNHAEEVAHYVLDQHSRLTEATRLWHDTWYGSSLPHWLLDRLFSTVSTLATSTCQWWGNGRFWAWEGVGCCSGTCTHVWNYAHALARLFPSLEQSVREMQDFNPKAGFTAETGKIRYRAEEREDGATDGQAGTVLKAFREHLISADDEFLRRNWPRIRRTMEFLIAEDTDGNGMIGGDQHNTYDYSLHGPNTFVGSLYLAALRAAERMADEVGEPDFARTCRTLFKRGSALTIDTLFNGQYLVQQVDTQDYPQHQYATGCLSDQLFGQGWARQVGLGSIYPQHVVDAALRSIWKYNWAPDVESYSRVHSPQRPFVDPGESGLLNCTWPLGAYLPEGIAYHNEVWTGVEYQVAGHMAWEGMITEALAICRAIHDRYHPAKRNPWNEIECGDHYARGMASYGVFLALCGFEYDGPKCHLGFAPRISPQDFRAAFTAAEGWGTLTQQQDDATQTNSVAVKWGRVKVKTLAAQLPDRTTARGAVVAVSGHTLDSRAQQDGLRLRIIMPETVELGAADVMLVKIPLSS